MKTLATLEGPAFLRRCNQIRHSVADFMAETKIKDLWFRQPELTGKETEDEKNVKLSEQVKKNLSDILDTALDVNAEQTYTVLQLLCVPEDGEELPTGFDLMLVGLEMLTSQKVIDFFTQLVKLVQAGILG